MLQLYADVLASLLSHNNLSHVHLNPFVCGGAVEQVLLVI